MASLAGIAALRGYAEQYVSSVSDGRVSQQPANADLSQRSQIANNHGGRRHDKQNHGQGLPSLVLVQ